MLILCVQISYFKWNDIYQLKEADYAIAIVFSDVKYILTGNSFMNDLFDINRLVKIHQWQISPLEYTVRCISNAGLGEFKKIFDALHNQKGSW